MKLRKAIRLTVLLLVTAALVSVWVIVSAADGQLATVTVNTTATYNHVGVATVGGSLACSDLGSIHVYGTLTQPIGRRDSVSGSFSNDFSCGPGSPVGWSAQAVPSSGKFGGGSATLTGYFSGNFRVNVGYAYPSYPPYPNCYGPIFDYGSYTYYYQCYVNGSFGPQTVKLDNAK